MRVLISAMLIIVSIIHLLPLSGSLGVDSLTDLYGIGIVGPDLEILLRHRAVLFGILGAFLLAAAFRPVLQAPALTAGFVSVLSFLWLAWLVGDYNSHLVRVVIADCIALACLTAATAARFYLSVRRQD